VVLLFSGGLDSGLLLALAAPVLGPDLIALTYRGLHIPPGELAGAWQLARRFQVRHLILEIDPLQLADFRENTPERCYACKKAIIARAWEVVESEGAKAIWDATNMDDLSDFRPGLKAARELGVLSPFLELGWGKQEIREQSRRLDLPWQKSPQSCLATRFPYNTILTRENLARVGEAEAWLRVRGFTHVRLRVQGDRTRLELLPEEWPQFLKPGVRRAFLALLHRLGWEGLELEMVGGAG
jgi:uncharacterized protein